MPELNIGLIVTSFLCPSSFVTSPHMTIHAHLALRDWPECEAKRIKVSRLHKCMEDSWSVLHVFFGVHSREMEVLLERVGKEVKCNMTLPRQRREAPK